MLRTYKYLLRPTAEQERGLEYLLGQARLVYNAALEQRISTYQDTGKGLSYNAQWTHFRDLRNTQPDRLGQLNASALQHTLRRLDKSFAAFFRRIQAGEKPGFPRFKNPNRFHSLEFTYGDGCKLRVEENGRRSFYLQNIGILRLCFHRPLPAASVIKHVVVKRVHERWYVCLMLEIPDALPATDAPPIKPLGIDVGLHSLAGLSTGETIENPRWLRQSLVELRILQRRAARQTRGSHRRRNTMRQITGLHEHIANQRRDFLHQLSHRLVKEHDLIAVEDMPLAFMNRNRHLALSSHDAGPGELRQLLAYKAEDAGRRMVAVNPFNTSQRCSGCGDWVEKTLAIRVHHCPACGLVLDRDVNAARNILHLALGTLATPTARTGRAKRNVTQRGVRALRSCPP
jgi:putative transposase